MTDLPVRRFTKVWIKKRRNRAREGGKRSVSYTLQWSEFGQDRYQSLGPHATLAYAREAARRKEQELNSFDRQFSLVPITWTAFRQKYLDTTFPGHDLPPAKRREQAREWAKGLKSLLRERAAMDNFERLIRPGFCHEITSEAKEKFATARLAEVGSAESVDTDLRALRHLCNVMEEWKHRPENSNPFAGRGKATVGARRRRAKERARPESESKARYYTFDEVKAILALANREATEAAQKSRFAKKRLRVLVHFLA